MENKKTYNLKIKEYPEQAVFTTYYKPIIIREKLDNIIIQLKKYRNQNSELWLTLDNDMGLYYCNSIYLDSEIKMTLFDNDLEDYYNYVLEQVKCLYYHLITTDKEKEERSINSSLSRTKQKVYDLAYCNNWDMFITLTFDDEKLIKKYGEGAWNYDVCVNTLHSFFTVLKRNFPNVSYLGVPELHHNYYNVKDGNVVLYNNKWFTDKDYYNLLNKQNLTNEEKELINKVKNEEYKRRFHFHFLFNNFPFDKLVDSNEKTKNGDIIYNLINYKWGFTTCTLIKSLQASQHYITKYITKDLVGVSINKKRYWCSKNLNLPSENNYNIDLQETKELKEELFNSIESDSRIKRIDVENGRFKNIINKYVVKNWEVLKNKNLEEFVEVRGKNKVKIITLDFYIKDMDSYMNDYSIFNPFNNVDYCIVKRYNKFYKFSRINGKGILTEL